MTPPCDPVVMFTVPVLALMHNSSDARMEFLIRDRFSGLRFPGFQIGEPPPDQKTIRLFREKLTEAGAFRSLFAAFEDQLRERGYKPAGSRIVDATPISAPRQRMTKEEKTRARAGEAASDIWPLSGSGCSGQGSAEGHRCALDGQIFKGQNDRGRREGCGPC